MWIRRDEFNEMTVPEKVDRLTVSNHRQSMAVIFLVVAMFLGIGVVFQIINARDIRRREVDERFRQLYCLLISTSKDNPKQPIIQKIRHDYRCGPFKPPILPTSPPPSNGAGAFRMPGPIQTPTPRAVVSPVADTTPGAGHRTVRVQSIRVA